MTETETKLAVAERQLAHCAHVLKAFYIARVSLSAIAPVLALAEDLNPDLLTGEAHV